MRITIHSAFLCAATTIFTSTGLAQSFGPDVVWPPIGIADALKTHITVADVDNDCLDEVILVNWPTTNSIVHNVMIFENDGLGGLLPPLRFAVPSVQGFSPRRADAAHLNGDSRAELIIARGRRLDIHELIPGTGYGPPISTNLPLTGVGDMEVVDMNNDDIPDVVVLTGGSQAGAIQVFFSDGTLGWSSIGTTGLARAPEDLDVDDYDGDGLLDVATLDPANFEINVYRSLGNGLFAPPQSHNPFWNQPTRMASADVNGDGDVDIVVAAQDGFMLLENDGTGSFAIQNLFPSSFANIVSLVVDDFDGDGDEDIAYHGVEPFNVKILANNGGGGFAPPMVTAMQAGWVTGGDLDNNGTTDLVFAHLSGGVGRALNLAPPRWALDGLSTSVNGGDFDGTSKTFQGGDVIRFGTDVRHDRCLLGRQAALLMSLPPTSALGPARTPIGNGFDFPGLTIPNPASIPGGSVVIVGDSLGFGSLPRSPSGAWVDLGVGPLTMGAPPYTLPIPPLAFGSGTSIRMQAIYYLPIPQNFLTFGLAATNEVELIAQ